MAITAGFAAGQVLTAAALNAAIDRHEPAWARKTSDESVTSSVTLQDDDHLFVSVAANCTYRIDGHLIWVGNSTGKIRTRWTFPASATLHLSALGPFYTTITGAATNSDVDFAVIYNATSSPSSELWYSGSTANLDARIAGTLIVGASAGTFRLQWAQQASTGTATTVKAGSWIELRRVE